MTRLLPAGMREPLLVLLLCAAVIAAVFYPAVFRGELIYQEDSAGSDSLDHNITRRYLAVKSLTEYGEFPLWEPKIACGAPLFAESEAGIFHPSFLFFFLSSLTAAVNLTVLSAVLIAMLGSYAWSRCLGLGPLAAGVSALAYGLGYTFLLRTEQLNIIHVIAWLPASLAVIYTGAVQGKKRWWFALVIIWTLQFLASHFQMFAICQFCCWVYIIGLLAASRRTALSRTKLLLGFVSALIFTVLLGAVQLLTMLELNPKTTRESAYPLELLQELSPTWPMLAGLADPFYPAWRHAPWNTETEDTIAPGKMVIYARDSFQYIGILPILLCFMSLAGKRRRLALGIWLLAGFFLLTALGPSHGIYYILWRYIPFVSSFRFPGRFAIPLMCSLACLAGIGTQNLQDMLLQRWGRRCSAAAAVIILLLTCADLGYVNSQVQGYLPAGWDTPPLVLDAVRSPRRIYSPYSFDMWKKDLNASPAADFPRQNVFWRHRSLLSPGLVPLYGHETPDDYLGFVMGIMLAPAADRQAAVYTLFRQIKDLPAPEVERMAPKLGNWLRILGISHIIVPEPLPEGWPQEEFSTAHCVSIPELPGAKVYVYALSRPAERIRLVPALQAHVSAGDIDLAKVLQENSPNVLLQSSQFYGSCLYEPDFSRPAGIGRVSTECSTNHTLRLAVSCDRNAYLVIGSTYDDNWQAEIDGRPAPVRPANMCMQCLTVPAGKHRIELRYVSPAFNLGWKISLTALAVFAALAAAVLLRRSRRDSAAEQGN